MLRRLLLIAIIALLVVGVASAVGAIKGKTYTGKVKGSFPSTTAGVTIKTMPGGRGISYISIRLNLTATMGCDYTEGPTKPKVRSIAAIKKNGSFNIRAGRSKSPVTSKGTFSGWDTKTQSWKKVKGTITRVASAGACKGTYSWSAVRRGK